MCDIMSKNDPLNEFRPFGGMTVVLDGDFRQIFPVVRKGLRQDIVDTSINSSKILTYCNVLRLTVNTRLGASSYLQSRKKLLILASGYSQLETTTTLRMRMVK